MEENRSLTEFHEKFKADKEVYGSGGTNDVRQHLPRRQLARRRLLVSHMRHHVSLSSTPPSALFSVLPTFVSRDYILTTSHFCITVIDMATIQLSFVPIFISNLCAGNASNCAMKTKTADTELETEKMHIKPGFLQRKWRRLKTEMTSSLLAHYRRCVVRVKRCLRDDTVGDTERRKSQAKLHPLPDRPLRRAASKLNRKPTNELERLRRKGDDWTANDLFRFQYSDPESGTPEERKQLCYDWLDRLHNISKKYCYLAWYEAAIYACYYRLAPIMMDSQEKQKLWLDVRREYAEIFMMGRRIWRRAIHPSRLRVFYDLAMLCVRFGQIENDDTIVLFRDLLSDATNFDFKVLNEVEFIKSIDKVIKLENHVIDQFYKRRRSSGSIRSSFRSRRNLDRSPSRRSTTSYNGGLATSGPDEADQDPAEADRISLTSVAESLSKIAVGDKIIPPVPTSPMTTSLLVPTIVIEGPDVTTRSSSPRLVHFEDGNRQT
ncbi:unnamed protein product [Caenorhabditis auriculariae]|uniref:DUF7758 domain-containing protein n=1 Tax=Caenorhabditis auriculariae TaxID=2777116 RepID=A0A8S1HD70_9PELO|nr:unnamed protein product [Caenorhabditis auriculariae]